MIFAFIAMAAFAIVIVVLVASGEWDERVRVADRFDRSLKATRERKQSNL